MYTPDRMLNTIEIRVVDKLSTHHDKPLRLSGVKSICRRLMSHQLQEGYLDLTGQADCCAVILFDFLSSSVISVRKHFLCLQ